MVDLELRYGSSDAESPQRLLVLVEKAVANDVLVSSNDVPETPALLCATHDAEYHSRES